MKKFFSLVLALVMALSLTTVAWGADYTATTDAEAQQYLNEVTSGTVTLDGDFGYLDFRSVTTPMDGVKVVGTAGTTVEDLYITVHEGDVKNITFENITFDGATGGLRSNNIVLENVTIKNCKFINGATISFGNYPVKNLTVVNCVFDNTGSTNADKTAIYANAGVEGTTVITGNTISNPTYNAIQLATTVSGTVEITDNVISNTADRAIRFGDVAAGATLAIQDNTVTDGADGDGEVMKATSVAADATIKAWNNDWDGGTVVNPELEDIGSGVTTDANGLITGGTFTTAPADAWIASGYRLVNGAVVSVPANTTGVVGGYEGMFTTAGATRQAVTNLTKTPAVAPLDLDEDGYYNRVGDRMGSIEYYTLNLGGAVAQNYYKVNTVGEADLIIYVGDSKTPYMYLANEPAGGFTYITGATAFANFGKACGQFKWAAVDTTKTYYAYDGQVYVVDPTGAVNLMVNGVFTQATNVTANGTWVAHVPTYTQDKTGAVTAIKCANCPTEAVIVANYAALPDAVKAAGAYFGVPGSAAKQYYWPSVAVVAPGTLVESAETFDAGIAMYVGMSVLAATGSAVVLKKKD